MTRPNPQNAAASVRARLLNLTKQSGEEYEQLLTRFCIERLLYRLGRSPHAGRFVLKGAMLFLVWDGQIRRPTRDLDLLGFGDISEQGLRPIFAEICQVPCPEDGIRFLPDSIQVQPIREEQQYGGLRVLVEARLGTARVRCQVDVGTGDALTPPPAEADFPSLLDLPRPRLRMYRPETVVAEKLEAMVQLGIANSRMKDFFDLWHLARRFAFDGPVLADAVRATFARRGTVLPEAVPVALSDDFARDPSKLSQWTAFRRRAKLEEPADLATVQRVIGPFLLPLIEAARQGTSPGQWSVGGPWTST